MNAFPIPAEAMDDCGAILGRRGAGKSGTGRFLLEHVLEQGHRTCVIDPKGDWYGVRMLADGSPSNFDVRIFGGAHGDMAIDDAMGEALGRLVAEHDLSCIVDLSSFPSQAAMRRFVRDFSDALFRYNRQPITLFVDECDQLAPQRVSADMAQLLHNMEALIRQGRQRGIFMWMLTQRPQVLNKNLLSQAETLVAMKMTTPHDRQAIKDWMDAHDPEQAKAIMQQLSKLSIGEAFVWVPGEDYLERVQFPMFKTFDSGRTPKHGETIQAVKLPEIYMGDIEAALQAVVKPVEEGKRIAASPRTIDIELQVRLKDDEIKRLQNSLGKIVSRVENAIQEIGQAQQELNDILTQTELSIEVPAQGGGGQSGDACQQSETGRLASDGQADKGPRKGSGIGTLTPRPAGLTNRVGAGDEPAPTGRPLDVLCALADVHPKFIAATRWAAMAGLKRNSTWRGYLARIRPYLEQEGDTYRVTAEGLKLLPSQRPALPAPGRDLVEYWAGKVSGKAGEILKELYYQAGLVPRSILAELVEVDPNKSTFRGYLAELNALELIVWEPGQMVRVNPDLLP